MTENNFNEQFQLKTRGAYPFLKFVKAVYSKGDKTVRLDFLRSTSMYDGQFNDEMRKEVERFVQAMMPEGVYYEIVYQKTYADENTVKNKVVQYITREKQALTMQLKDGDVSVTVSGGRINVKIAASESMIKMLKDCGFSEDLENFLDENFVETPTVEFTEKELKEGEKAFLPDDAVGYVSGARLIKIELVEQVFGKSRISVAPSYISDMKETTGLTVLCGKVSSFVEKTYKNKNYGAEPAKNSRFKINTTDEFLPRFNFTLNDTTGNISAVVFPRDESLDKLRALSDGDLVAAEGTVGYNQFAGGLQIMVRSLWKAEIDFDGIVKSVPQKKENSDYVLVYPEKFVEEEQTDMFSDPTAVNAYLKGKTFVVFDTETTGTDTAKDKIVEISAAKIVDGKIVETWSSLCNPGIHIPEATTAIHGIKDEDVAEKPSFAEILPDFYKFTRGAVMVGHNVDFDYKMLLSNGRDSGYVFDNELLDTYAMARKYLVGKTKNFKLGSISEALGIDLTNAHRALFDSLATAKCFIKMSKFLSSK